MDFRNEMKNMLNEQFEVAPDKMEKLLDYAEHHANVETINSLHTANLGNASSEHTLLPMSIMVFMKLNLEGKTFEISDKALPSTHIAMQEHVDVHDMLGIPNIDEQLTQLLVDAVSEKINEGLASASGIRVHLLVSSVMSIGESTLSHAVSAKAEYELIP